MARPIDDPHFVTEVRTDALSTGPTRHRPRIAWTDAAGPHEVALESRTVVGSAAGVDLVVADPAVSRLHAELEPRAEGLWVRDLGSRNGTRVEGILVTGALVPDGARVQFGPVVAVVRYPREAQPVALWPSDHFGPLWGVSTAMRELFARLYRVAPTDSTVLIQGETGTGKELVAQAIHEASPRRAQPFVVVDCGALPEALLEAELFGHTKGAFTGAASAREGAIASAEGGTLFLDEVGEMPLAMQPKLLRALESRTVRRVGESQHRKVNVRFLSATHRDLRQLVNARAFREDLYFRLAVLPVTIAPLRERVDDIPLLVHRFVPDSSRPTVTPELLRELMTRPWMGNVRELRNFVEQLVALGTREALAMLAADGSTRPPTAAAPSGVGFPAVSIDEPFKDIRERWTEHLEREYVRQLLVRHGGNVNAVAQAAGLNRAYVYRLVKKHAL